MLLPASDAMHGWVVANTALATVPFVKNHDLGYVFAAGTGFLIERDPDTVRAPDLSFVRKSRVTGTPLTIAGFFPGPPDIAVEVLSPGDSASEVQEKTEQWLRASCCEVWLIDPRRKTATVCTLQGDAVVSQSVLQLSTKWLPGFTLEVATLFE